MDQNIFIFVFIIILIIIFLMSNCENLVKIETFEDNDTNTNILEIDEYYLRINDNTQTQKNVFNIIILGNQIVDYGLNKHDIIQLQMELKNNSSENIYLKLKSKPAHYTTYTELECESIYNLNDKIMKNINVFNNKKENKTYYKFKLFKIGNLDDNCIIDTNISVFKDKELYKIRFEVEGDNDSIKKKYFDKFKVDDILSIIDTSKPLQDPNKNKFLIQKLDENYDIILQNNSNLSTLVPLNNDKKKQIILVRLDMNKIIDEYYNQLKYPLGELSYYNFEIKNLLEKVDSIKKNVNQYIKNEQQK